MTRISRKLTLPKLTRLKSTITIPLIKIDEADFLFATNALYGIASGLTKGLFPKT